MLIKLKLLLRGGGIRRTICYFATKWFRKGTITAKVDAYYGGMSLEILCCNSSVAFAKEDEEDALMDGAYEWFVQRKLACWWKLMNDMKRLERLVMVAIWCIQEDAALRSIMRKVTQMLEGVVEVSVPPRPFGIFISSS